MTIILESTCTLLDWCFGCLHDHTTSDVEGDEVVGFCPGHTTTCDCRLGDDLRPHSVECPCFVCRQRGYEESYGDALAMWNAR